MSEFGGMWGSVHPEVVAAICALGALYLAAWLPRVLDLAPLDDQRLGGLLMWVPAGVIPLVVFTIVFFRWAAAEADADEPV